ncbi:HlyC/CorC family transporter [Coxiella burnetii]|uniref:Magnesium and cobalt efflux protein n=1 Tax=Coxiella burnetii (strain RSA 493 / Nine Mile phase I) TaxID=227377 RepID=Q83E77_COXBU|nr:HlyC/CorC family transporter [Coxiella burnetii]NP_819488.1 magnesium and cobalt efflux protein [Coxiella burnetii RSA 493]AAO90002.1 magnesium and cobalt efflux protein [Coxiella burnetii RSA 493]ABX78903.1 transporter, HlyC/CorC (HCC) family [Coxiella burnetii RSA 331]AML49614.1 magnesium/cobalt efflux protein [Coxiella burnetii]AML55520.1 magnesium/cobalt efflux protein [Coxiella burnetii]ARI65330.1 magnesium/cobalt efflux protein [Coxiella burnetii]
MTVDVEYLGILLVLLIFLSAFFSGSETGMMALNRYRLRHLARKGHVKAQRVVTLLKRPDRLLGVILIGNTFANILASAVATVIAVHYLGDLGVIISTVILTFLILVFAETTPKTLAALYPQRVAFPASLPLQILLRVFYPLVWLVNTIANAFLRIFGVKVSVQGTEVVSAEELRSIVREVIGKGLSGYQQMLLRVLNLGQMTVEDVMVPRNRIHGIDIRDDWHKIVEVLLTSEHDYLPIYRENIDRVIGLLNLRRVMQLLSQQQLTKEKLVKVAEEVYFIPEVTLLNQQLLNFRERNKTVGLVVDEYGDIEGLVTLRDILEEVVGEFATGIDGATSLVQFQKEGSYLIDARISVRDLNRIMQWDLPIKGPKTLSGLIIEDLESIPIVGICIRLSGYPMEIVKVSRNAVRLVKVWSKF